MRSKFDEQLEHLNHELISMGGLCENAIAMSAKALTDHNKVLASKVPELVLEIDQKERDIETMCMKLLLQQQPVAKDLRVISSALKMVTDMERIGDNSGDIAEIVCVADFQNEDDLPNIHDMALITIQMVTKSVDAFVKRDIALAHEVVATDDVVDRFFTDIKHELINRIKEGNTNGETTLDLLMIVKYFERIGDHAVNIAQWGIFSITGVKE